ncbi:MAG: hypothetical protein AAF211_26960 [Myxococcota bacterium]
MASPSSPPAPPWTRRLAGVYRYTLRAIGLVWQTDRRLLLVLALGTLAAGALPAAIAWVGRQIVDGVVLAAQTGTAEAQQAAIGWIAAEFGLVAIVAFTQRGLDVTDSLLRAKLGHRVNVMILEKALQLDLTHFEDPELYDKMTRARRQASSRPLSLVRKTFGLLQNGLALSTYGALLIGFSPFAVLVLLAASVPAFVAETRFAGEAFRLFSWRAPETREQSYLEVVMAREDYAKEVQLLGLGPRLLDRYHAIFDKLFVEDRSLTLRRGFWGGMLGLVSTGALYGAYGWIAWSTMAGTITIGAMTMYLLVFKQGQGAFSAVLRAIGGMYEDNLYLSNLYDFLATETERRTGGVHEGAVPDDGVRFEGEYVHTHTVVMRSKTGTVRYIRARSSRERG